MDYLALAGDPKGTIFDRSRSTYVPREPKEVVAKALGEALAAFSRGTVKTRLYEVSGDTVALTVKYGNTNVPLANGRTTNTFPRARFADILEAIISDVEDGAFDEKLTALQAAFKANLATARAAQASRVTMPAV